VTRAVLIGLDNTPEVVELPDDTMERVHAMQKHVGGPFDLIPSHDSECSIWVNDEGVLRDLPVNLVLTMWLPMIYGMRIHGPALVMGRADAGGKTLGCPDEVVQYLTGYEPLPPPDGQRIEEDSITSWWEINEEPDGQMRKAVVQCTYAGNAGFRSAKLLTEVGNVAFLDSKWVFDLEQQPERNATLLLEYSERIIEMVRHWHPLVRSVHFAPPTAAKKETA
jgi:hypothetical protein